MHSTRLQREIPNFKLHGDRIVSKEGMGYYNEGDCLPRARYAIQQENSSCCRSVRASLNEESRSAEMRGHRHRYVHWTHGNICKHCILHMESIGTI